MKQSERLMYELKQSLVAAPVAQLHIPDQLICNLLFMYHVMRASENLLYVAAQKSEGELRDYYEKHLQEEKSHELWLAQDLLTVGIEAEKTPVPYEAVAMVGSLYYLIYHVDPAALLGYMAVLECFPLSLDRIEELEIVHGKQLIRTLRYHATHDVEHGGEVLDMIDRIDSQRFHGVMLSALQTMQYVITAVAKFAK